MTPGIRRARLPAILLAALAALLVFAAAASAETRTGESSTAVATGSPLPEATLVNASASYETGSGSTVFKVTTAGAPAPESLGEMIAGLTTSPSCTAPASPEAVIEGLILGPPPLFVIENLYSSSDGHRPHGEHRGAPAASGHEDGAGHDDHPLRSPQAASRVPDSTAPSCSLASKKKEEEEKD